MARRTFYLPATMIVTVLVACVVASIVLSQKADAAFPGSNGAIAASYGVDGRIYRMNADGFGQTPITSLGSNQDPTWSSDGKWVAFAHTGSDNDIYWTHSVGMEDHNLTNNPAEDIQPSFFPDYHKIAFASNRSGNRDIYKMTVDDNGTVTKTTQLTRSSANDVSPVVSPNGKKIAFVSNRAGVDNNEIYVMNSGAPEGPNNRPVRLTKNSALEDSPDWSPSGKRITLASTRSGNYDIFVMKPVPESSTNKPLNLTRKPSADYAPAWSPDGKKIAFVSYRFLIGSTHIFRMHADGTHQTDLYNASNFHSPSWQPDP